MDTCLMDDMHMYYKQLRQHGLYTLQEKIYNSAQTEPRNDLRRTIAIKLQSSLENI